VNVLLIADDEATAGRMRAIGRVLETAGHRVSVFDAPTVWGERPEAAGVDARPRWTADAVVASPWTLPPSAFLRRHVLVADGVAIRPVELAATAEGRRRHDLKIRRCDRRAQVVAARADAVLVAGGAQRAWWSERLHRREAPLLDLPSGIPDADPEGHASGLPGVPPSWAVVLWWGGTAPWLDLDTLLAARAFLGGATVSLVVPTSDPSGRSVQSLSASEIMRRASAHGLRSPQVVALDRQLPEDERHRVLAQAAVAAVLHHPGPEAQLAFRARALDGLWTGVPLLVTEGGEVSDLTRANGWGAVVPPHDPRSTAAAMELLLRGRTRTRCRESMTRDRERWRWSRVAQPLVDLLPDLPIVPRTGPVGTALRLAAERLVFGGPAA